MSGTVRKVGLVGLALSHPFTFAEILQRTSDVELHFWDSCPERMKAFDDQFPNAVAHTDFAELLETGLSGVMICTESHLHHQFSIPFIRRNIPTFIDKCMTVDSRSLSELQEAVNADSLVFSSSILRFSPVFRRQADRTQQVDRSHILHAQASVFHSIEGYLKPANAWQDDPTRGGGTLVNMGVHGLELMFLNFGSDVRRVFAQSTKRVFDQSQSEDFGLIHLAYADGLICTIQLVGASHVHGYGMIVITREGTDSVWIPSVDAESPLEEYGYVGCVDEFRRMTDGIAPAVSFADTVRAVEVLLAARHSAACGTWVSLA
ncbi:Gfo/Idh/MocA family protein [Alicyclobacillus dauci]|uniref:Gfo/Idh/MocA family oxidoreductase n=1 Tax=Alicyclobacillus dauci TaxID=1475485 RepID=A0ABY6YYC9_9BACL|nr:Gfo/Idh/MocA family oxidoreductase [Alicyclobacillus dauci]WAH35582.1 Gfo/Idh/MocA family oxidoreductase [Alicyclobacillus dauci]